MSAPVPPPSPRGYSQPVAGVGREGGEDDEQQGAQEILRAHPGEQAAGERAEPAAAAPPGPGQPPPQVGAGQERRRRALPGGCARGGRRARLSARPAHPGMERRAGGGPGAGVAPGAAPAPPLPGRDRPPGTPPEAGRRRGGHRGLCRLPLPRCSPQAPGSDLQDPPGGFGGCRGVGARGVCFSPELRDSCISRRGGAVFHSHLVFLGQFLRCCEQAELSGWGLVLLGFLHC